MGDTFTLSDLTLDSVKAQAFDFVREGATVTVRPTKENLFEALVVFPDVAVPGGDAKPVSESDRPLPTGEAILEIAKRHVGQKYAHGPVDYTDAKWPGAFDCAEFASYCAYRAYRILFGTRPTSNAAKADAYTGYWKEDTLATPGATVPLQTALNTPGAFLLRYPPKGEPMGHIAISEGDGVHIYEAHSTKRGLIEGVATGRRWDTGVLLPGVTYKTGAGGAGGPPGGQQQAARLLIYRLLDPLAGFDDTVQKLQEALVQKGFLTEHDVNGIFDQPTYQAALRFQEAQELLVDGEIGPETGRLLLGAAWDEVRAQTDAGDDVPATSDRDLLTMARTLFGEARGEPTQGKEAVASVILNRSRSGRYPSNIADVCLQSFQFSCWNKNDPNRPKMLALKPKSDKNFDECLAAADRVIRGLVPDRTDGALHYHTKSVKPKWVAASPKARISAIIGNHIFYTGVR